MFESFYCNLYWQSLTVSFANNLSFCLFKSSKTSNIITSPYVLLYFYYQALSWHIFYKYTQTIVYCQTSYTIYKFENSFYKLHNIHICLLFFYLLQSNPYHLSTLPLLTARKQGENEPNRKEESYLYR